jgi:hypothetical protein
MPPPKQASSEPASQPLDEREPSSASSTEASTQSQATRISMGATEDELSQSSASALDSARQRYNALVCGSGQTLEPSSASPDRLGMHSPSSTVNPLTLSLSSWSPIPRFLIAELERMGATRPQAVKAVVIAYWAAGEEVVR